MENSNAVVPASLSASQLPINANVQRNLSDRRVVSMLTRHMGSETKARQLILRVARLAHVNQSIARCHPLSVASAVLTVAEEQLELGKEIYLIPYKDRLEAQTSYLGELARIRRATNGKALPRCAIIREGDDFSFEPSDDRPIQHRVATELDFESNDVRRAIGAWAVVVENGQWHSPVLMTRPQLEAHRDQYSRIGQRADSIWQTNPDAAWLKTVVRRSAKLVGRGGLIDETEERQQELEAELVEELQPEPKPRHGPDAASDAVEVAEEVLGVE